MTNRGEISALPDISMHKAATVAGFAIIIMTLAAVVATDIAIGPLIELGNPTATIQNIKSNLMLFRVGIVSWIVVLICDIIAAWGLYVFLSPVDNSISLLSAWLRIVYTSILGTSILNLNYVLELIVSEYHLTTIGYTNLESQTWLFLNSFDSSWSVGLVVFSIHIFFLGYLGYKSTYIPKLLSVFLIIGFVGYMLIHLFNLLIPQFQNLLQILEWIFIIPMLSEVAFGLWLVVKGKNVKIDKK